jgi:hypothetical protein
LPSALAYDKPLCASLDGFTLHAATRAGALDAAGREALLRYVLRPPVAQERVVPQKDGLIAITLKRAYADGSVAVEMDPLSLLCRLAMSVPPPRYHTVKYAGVLVSASPLRARIAPKAVLPMAQVEDGQPAVPRRRSTYRPWAELLKRTFDIDVLCCPSCGGRMKAFGAGHRFEERCPLSARDGRSDRCAVPLAQPWPAVVAQRRAAPKGARRRRVEGGVGTDWDRVGRRDPRSARECAIFGNARGAGTTFALDLSHPSRVFVPSREGCSMSLSGRLNRLRAHTIHVEIRIRIRRLLLRPRSATFELMERAGTEASIYP